MSSLRYLNFKRYCWINQHVQYHLFVQSVYRSRQMKEQLFGIDISFIWRQLINCSSCSTIVCGINSDLVDTLVSTIVYMFVIPTCKCPYGQSQNAPPATDNDIWWGPKPIIWLGIHMILALCCAYMWNCPQCRSSMAWQTSPHHDNCGYDAL